MEAIHKDELTEIRDMHFSYVRQHKSYAFTDSGKTGDEYLEVLHEYYTWLAQRPYHSHRNLRSLLNSDIQMFNKLDKVSLRLQSVEKQVIAQCVSFDADMLWAFITIGFNEQTVTPQKMKSVSENVAGLKYFKECSYVLEKFRENGIHHHTHFLVKFHKKEYKSKVIDWIFQTKGLKEICLSKSFIDIKGPLNSQKGYQTYALYEQYILGNKQESKLPYCVKDEEWRKKNNL